MIVQLNGSNSFEEEFRRREEEFVLLYEAHRLSNLPFPQSAYEKFSLANKDPAECKADFRVEKRDIPLLLFALRVPPVFQYGNGTIYNGVEGQCIMLKRFAYPCQNIAELKEGIKTHIV